MSKREISQAEDAYLLSKDEDARLRGEISEVQDLSSEMQQAFKITEEYLGQQFVAYYGELLGLSPEQDRYIQEQRILVLTPEILLTFRGAWKVPLLLHTEEAELNGNIYSAYRPKNAARAVDINQDVSYVGGEHIWHGHIPIYALQQSLQNVVISPDYLDFQVLQNRPLPFGTTSETGMQIAMDRFRKAEATKKFAGEGMHEKVHGLQDPNIPFPILEAQAYYLQEDFTRRICNLPMASSSNHEAALFFGELLGKYGPNVHKLLTGNLHDKTEASVLLGKLKGEFTPATIKRVFPRMEWIRQPVQATIIKPPSNKA